MKKKLMAMVEIKLPSVPNFILCANGDKLPVTDFSEEELTEVGKEWTEALIHKRRFGITSSI
jgi:hypothetical protein